MSTKFKTVVTTLNDKNTELKSSLKTVEGKKEEALVSGEICGYKLAIKEIEETEDEAAIVLKALEKKVAALKEGLKTVKVEYDVHFINATIQGLELVVNEMKQLK
ncbi:hypothetical protein bcgnr5372_26880 [Bacillus luti]|nr:hypothetical protein [Bacillus cereus]HDR8331427.1 hypothetical protein [Bacillus cereus]HDR8336594.1 hypothetical protein [Bacillus cereus]